MAPRLGGLILGAALLAWSAPPSAARAAELVIEDGLAPDQVAEITHIFIDGVDVGGFALTLDHPYDRIIVHLPDRPTDGTGPRVISYVLCGQTTVRADDGTITERPVNDSGEITDPDGRSFFAYTNGYTAYFLLETDDPVPPSRPNAARAPADVRTHLGPRCPAPIASVPQGFTHQNDRPHATL